MAGPFQRFEPRGHGGPRIREIPLRLVLPNLITVLAICAGLSGIGLAFENRFELAVAMVLVAAFLDGIDGRIARMLKATSKFGAQMDSLADIVNFGVAPALVLYAYLLDRAGSPGWIAALLFAIACGLRLARFNVLDEDKTRPAWQSEYFVGVPAPASARSSCCSVYLVFIGAFELEAAQRLSSHPASAILVAFLLVSRLPVWSGKRLRVPGDTVMPMILGIVFFALLSVSSIPGETLSVGVWPISCSCRSASAPIPRRSTVEAAREPPPADGETG